LIAPSAYRHGVEEQTILHAFNNPIRSEDLEEGLVMLIGPDRAGNLYELGVVDSSGVRWSCTRWRPAPSTSPRR